MRNISTECSSCGGPRETKHRYCKDCKNAYNREWRKTHPASEKIKRQNWAVSSAHMRVKRQGIEKQPCQYCGSREKIEMHHEDYDYPLLIIWLCHECHRKVTRGAITTERLERWWLIDPRFIKEIAEDINCTEVAAHRKLTRYYRQKRAEWIAKGRVGVFPEYVGFRENLSSVGSLAQYG